MRPQVVSDVTVRVLVVDDQAPFREAMAEVVAATDGFEVVGRAASGQDAVTACAALQADPVLPDVNPPGIGGPGAAPRMSPLPRRPVVLLLSTYDAEDVVGS